MNNSQNVNGLFLFSIRLISHIESLPISFPDRDQEWHESSKLLFTEFFSSHNCQGGDSLEISFINNQENEYLIISFFEERNIEAEEMKKILLFFKNLPKNSWFLLYPCWFLLQPKDYWIMIESLRLLNYYGSESLSSRYLLRKLNNVWGNYSIFLFGSSRLNIGEWDRTKRVCRFCGVSDAPNSFKRKAHAFPEALGNKAIVCFEICDNCNEYFGKIIEPALIDFFRPTRDMLGIKGKNGLGIIKCKNFELIRRESDVFVKLLNGNKPEWDGNEYRITLIQDAKVVMQNIYKALCLSFFSAIPADLLCHYENTINWVRGGDFFDGLPKVLWKNTLSYKYPHPEIVCFVEQNLNGDVPFSFCKIGFLNVEVYFIIPLLKNSPAEHEVNGNWANKQAAFFKAFDHTSFELLDLNDPTPRDIIFKLSGMIYKLS